MGVATTGLIEGAPKALQYLWSPVFTSLFVSIKQPYNMAAWLFVLTSMTSPHSILFMLFWRLEFISTVDWVRRGPPQKRCRTAASSLLTHSTVSLSWHSRVVVVVIKL